MLFPSYQATSATVLNVNLIWGIYALFQLNYSGVTTEHIKFESLLYPYFILKYLPDCSCTPFQFTFQTQTKIICLKCKLWWAFPTCPILHPSMISYQPKDTFKLLAWHTRSFSIWPLTNFPRDSYDPMNPNFWRSSQLFTLLFFCLLPLLELSSTSQIWWTSL